MTDLRQRRNGPWDDMTPVMPNPLAEPAVLIESTDGAGSGPFGPPPWTVRAKAFTEHGLFARVILEWNVSCALSQTYALQSDDTPARAERRRGMSMYIEAVQVEAERLAGGAP